MTSPTERTQAGSQALAVSNAMVHLMSRYAGRDRTKTRTTINTKTGEI